jgi:hypothetical protein
MMKRIMISRVIVAALAAPVLFAAPALAGSRADRNADLVVVVDRHHDHGHRDHYDERAANDAVRACRSTVADIAYDKGFRDVDFHGREVRQFGRSGFLVSFDAAFETKRSERISTVTCEVRRGEVRAVEGVPDRKRSRGYEHDHHHDHRGW